MKIAIANNLYYPYNRGGAESVVKAMIADLKAAGHEVFLLTLKPNTANGVKSPEIIISEGLKAYYFPSAYARLGEIGLGRRFLWHIGDLFSFRRSRAIKKILRAEKAELIITHNLMGLGYFLPYAIRKLKIRHEHYLHDIQLLYPSGLMLLNQEKMVDRLNAKLYQLFTRAFFASPTKVISPSFWLLGQHRQRGFFHDSEAEVKTSATVATKSPENTLRTSAPHQIKNFLFVGQIENHKGILLLIKAFLSARAEGANIKLHIVGDGALLSEAKSLAGKDEQIKFHGRLDDNGVKNLMMICDCLVVPSLCYENAPTTIFEAHSVDLPVLAANIGGIPEITNEQDKLFQAGDFMDLKNCLLSQAANNMNS